MALRPIRTFSGLQTRAGVRPIGPNLASDAAKLNVVLGQALGPSRNHASRVKGALPVPHDPSASSMVVDARQGTGFRPDATKLGMERLWLGANQWPSINNPHSHIGFGHDYLHWIRMQIPPLDVLTPRSWSDDASFSEKLRYFAHTAAKIALQQAVKAEVALDAKEFFNLPERGSAAMHTFYSLHAFKEALDYLEVGNTEQAWVSSMVAYQHLYPGVFDPAPGTRPYTHPDLIRFRNLLTDTAITIRPDNEELLYEAGKYLLLQFCLSGLKWDKSESIPYGLLSRTVDLVDLLRICEAREEPFLRAYFAMGSPAKAANLADARRELSGSFLTNAANTYLCQSHEVFALFFKPLLDDINIESSDEALSLAHQLRAIKALIERDFPRRSKGRSLKSLEAVRLNFAANKFKEATVRLRTILANANKADAYELIDLLNKLLDDDLPKLIGGQKK
jgi:hypothetical protein